jgi:putative FmdB family regulatory protein
MPIHEYKCDKCGRVFENFVMKEDGSGERECPNCGEAGARKILSSFASPHSAPAGGCPSGGCGGAKRGFS